MPISISVMSMLAAGLAHAGPMRAAPAGGGVIRAWSVPYSPVAPGMIAALQKFMRTDAGIGLISLAPSLGVIECLDPDSEAHRRIVGMMTLPSGFESRLRAAALNSDSKTRESVRAAIVSAYRGQNTGEKMRTAIQARADEITAAVSQGGLSVEGLSTAASELAPFSTISAQVDSVIRMASSARSERAMSTARDIASVLLRGKGSADLEQVPAAAIGNGRDDQLEGWRLHPAPEKQVAQRMPQSAGLKQSVSALLSVPDSAPSMAAKAFGILPHFVRSILARTSERSRLYQIQLLREEVARLLPSEAISFMAYMPQSSQDYLLDQLHGSEFISGAHQASWLKRLRQAHARLTELEALQADSTTSATRTELALTHLSLGIFHGFTYGFPDQVAQASIWSRGESLPDVDKAARHYQQALGLLGKDLPTDSRAVLLTKFLLGKHAINAAHAYSNASLYTRDGIKIPPEPQAAEYEGLARRMLGDVLHAVEPRVPASPSNTPELYFEARFHLLKLDKGQRASALERLLFDVLSGSSPGWVEAQLHSRYGLIFRLIQDLRWAGYDSRAMLRSLALFDIEAMIGGNVPGLTYHELIRRLVEEGSCEELRPLLR